MRSSVKIKTVLFFAKHRNHRCKFYNSRRYIWGGNVVMRNWIDVNHFRKSSNKNNLNT
jgi:hypothetical protein